MCYNDTDDTYYGPDYDPDWNPLGINTPSEFGWGDEWESGEP